MPYTDEVNKEHNNSTTDFNKPSNESPNKYQHNLFYKLNFIIVYFVLFCCFTLFYFGLFYFVSFCFLLFYFILLYFGLFYLILVSFVFFSFAKNVKREGIWSARHFRVSWHSWQQDPPHPFYKTTTKRCWARPLPSSSMPPRTRCRISSCRRQHPWPTDKNKEWWITEKYKRSRDDHTPLI